jgi:hypothetical protein
LLYRVCVNPSLPYSFGLERILKISWLKKLKHPVCLLLIYLDWLNICRWMVLDSLGILEQAELGRIYFWEPWMKRWKKRFLVCVIKDLLAMEMKRGKDNKAVVPISCILLVCLSISSSHLINLLIITESVPAFLEGSFGNFFKTVVNKLFEFMHEAHEGVQDMACDTFIRLHKMRRNFILLSTWSHAIYRWDFWRLWIPSLPDLQPQQFLTVYGEVC